MCPDVSPERLADVMKQQQQIREIEIHQPSAVWVVCLVIVLIGLMVGLHVFADPFAEWLMSLGVL